MDSENRKPAPLGQGEAGSDKNVTGGNCTKKVRPDTKEHKILSALAAGRSLNRFEAIRLNDTTLNSTISTLQSKGLFIDRKPEKVPCVNGTKTVMVCRYSLPETEIPKARQLLGLDAGEVAA